MLNAAVFMPIATARVRVTTTVKAGLRRSVRAQ